MSHKRIHVRVPVSGIAILSQENRIQLNARTLDISQGGVAVVSPEACSLDGTYDIVVDIDNDAKIEFSATFIRRDENLLAFKTFSIDTSNLRRIQQLVFKYQETEGFLDQLLQHNILDHWFLDEDGNEIEFTFNSDPEHD